MPRVDALRLSDDDGVEKTFLVALRERPTLSSNRGRFEGDRVKPVVRLNCIGAVGGFDGIGGMVCWTRLLTNSVAAGAKRLVREGLTTSEAFVLHVGESRDDCSGLGIIKVAAEDFLELSESARLPARGLVVFSKRGAQRGGRERSDVAEGAC